jgi:PHD/YefM family antitoxin component YafN of YafNO toxin-antitoxin module
LEVITMVKKIAIKETRAPYTIVVSEEDLGQGPVVLERNGEAVAALVSIEEYRQFVAWREQREKEARQRARMEAFERERAAFLRLKPQLLDTHRGLWVAIVGERVVDSDADSRALARRVYARFGYVPAYIQLVSEEMPSVELPSPEEVIPW